MKILPLVLIAAIAIGLITGCGEEPKDPLKPRITETDTISTVGEMKQSESIPAAPQAPNIGIPFVKEVEYYTDWQLKKRARGIIPAGTTIFTKVVFSEDMRHIAADNKTARPVLYYQIDKKRTRYRIAEHGARKADFVSGDAKPKGKIGTATFVCRYTIPANAKGSFILAVGKFSTDMEGNTLAAFYTHRRDLLLSQEKPIVEPPTEPEIPITPHRRRPGTRAFTGQVFFPGTTFVRSKSSESRGNAKPISSVVVTIASGLYRGEGVTTDRNGKYTFYTNEDKLHLRVSGEGLEPKEVIVHRSQPTKLANGAVPNFRNDPQKTPGNILIGNRWPDEVRFILQQTVLVYDLLYAENRNLRMGGFYSRGVVVVSNRGALDYTAHEIAHAHQHAIISANGSGDTSDWSKTEEGKAFIRARAKDWVEHGKTNYDKHPHFSSDRENAAETAAYFWSGGQWGTYRTNYYNLEVTAPNRLKWAKEWLPKK